MEKAQKQIKFLKEGRISTQIAIVQLSRDTARSLRKTGRIKIGWINCHIYERVLVVQCHKCLQFGPRQQNCPKTNRTEECLKCEENGHKAKYCANESFCSTCNKKEHCADQTKCQAFRKLFDEARRLRKDKY